jgi:dolichyl-diphosphooligosaccharide---protein glycosyltransferase
MTFRERLSGLKSIFYRPVVSRRSAIVFMAMSFIFVIALFMRIYPSLYGWYLNEFDPYFDYYASLHVVTLAQQHGLIYALFNNPTSCLPSSGASDPLASCHTQQGYFYWWTNQFWWPYGRSVASSSQVGLQLTGAMLYLFANGVLQIPVSYYDFLVFFPVLFGSLTIIPIFFFVRKLSNSAGGIFAALIFAVSPPILERGNLGWFKSEPLSLFLSITASYFFLTMYNAKLSMRGLVARALIAGLLLGYADISWGGGDEYVIILALVFLIAPFIKAIDQERTTIGGAIVIGAFLLVDALTPRPGVGELTGAVGLALFGSWLFTLCAFFLRKYGDPAVFTRNLIKVFLIVAFGGLLFLAFGTTSGLSGRYLTVIYSFYRSANPLIQSVAEQAVPTGSQFFAAYAVLILLGCFGAYAALRRKNIEALFALFLGVTGVYIASSFSRLMVYSTLAFAVLAAIGLVEVGEAILRPTSATISRKKSRIYEARTEIKVAFVAFMIVILCLPMFYPANFSFSQGQPYDLSRSGWFATANTPVSVANGGTSFSQACSASGQGCDWFQAFQFIRQTPENSTFLSWWDYGYWIAVMGNRTSLADNGTINETQIAQIGRVLMSTPQTSLQLLRNMHSPTYIVIFLAGSYVPETSQTGSGTVNYYFLTVQAPYPTPAGGDESKKQWFIRIGNTLCNPACFNETGGNNALMQPDDFTPTPYFFANSTLGQLMPFDNTEEFLPPSGSSSTQPVQGYSQTISATNNASGISAGYTELLTYDMKYPASNTSAPFQLAFESSSLPGTGTSPGNTYLYQCVLIYKVNYNAKF